MMHARKNISLDQLFRLYPQLQRMPHTESGQEHQGRTPARAGHGCPSGPAERSCPAHRREEA